MAFGSVLFSLIAAVYAAGFAGASQDDHQNHNPDYVSFLPGLFMPLPSPWYSGYLTYSLQGITIHTHYILIEAEFDDEGTKPLIYWSNGGPGASSMYGLMTELGPLLFSELSYQTDGYKETGIPTPLYNKYSWSKLGSLLLFDAPAPVGFSYCEGGDSSKEYGYSCLSWTDELASLNTYTALQAFYDKFPSYSSKQLFLTGESYGGIYIPNLAKRIVEGDQELLKQNLQGFAVGDGCVGTDSKICAAMFAENTFYNTLFLAGHHQLPLSTLKAVMDECGGVHGSTMDAPGCQTTLETAKQQAGGFFQYHLYDDCTYSNGLMGSVEGGLNDYPCGGGDVMGEFLNIPAVMNALHVQGPFYITDDAEGFDYTMTEPSVEPFYQSVNGELRVLVYNGDADPRINSFDAQNWTSHLGFDIVEDWTPWTIDGCRRMGGYVIRYAGDFDFLTIRGAGHMVPTYKPAASFAFLKAWIEGTDYPKYDPDCSVPPQMGKNGTRPDQVLGGEIDAVQRSRSRLRQG